MKKKVVKNNPLEFVSNVIKIKPDKKYLFILESEQGLTQEQYDRITLTFKKALETYGLEDSLGFIFENMKVKILEMDKDKKTNGK